MRQRHSIRHDQEGATATLFVIVLLTLLSVAMLAIDGGSLFVSQRLQVSDTDAAALAAARFLADDNCASNTPGAVEAAASRLLEDETSLEGGSVDIPPPCTPGGVVTVRTTRDADLFFAPLFGIDRAPTVVQSQAEFGFPDVLPGVRPIALCNADLHYGEWVNGNYLNDITATDAFYLGSGLDPHPEYAGADGVVHRIFFERLNATGGDCSDASGNWGWLDFDSGGNTGSCEDPDTNSELGCRIRQGYEGGVDVGLGSPAVLLDCNVDSEDIDSCAAQTGGAGSSTADDLAVITCDAGDTTETCPLSIFVVYRAVGPDPDVCAPDESNGGGNNGGGNNGGGNNGGGNNGGGNNGGGNNAEFCLFDLIPGVIWGADVGTGSPQPDNYFDIEFVDAEINGPVVRGTPPGGNAPATYELCGARDFDNCNTSTN